MLNFIEWFEDDDNVYMILDLCKNRVRVNACIHAHACMPTSKTQRTRQHSEAQRTRAESERVRSPARALPALPRLTLPPPTL